VASSSKGTSRRSKAETKEPKSTNKAKGKTKKKVAAAVDGEDVDMHDGDKEAAAAKESDPPEEDNNDSGEEELEERKAASKRCVLPAFQPIPKAELSSQCGSGAGSER
jgi:hypothetical protein